MPFMPSFEILRRYFLVLKKQISHIRGKRKMFCLGGVFMLSKGVASIFFLFRVLRVLW